MELKLERAGPAVVVRVQKGTLAIDGDTAELHDLVRALTIFDPGCSVIMDLERLRQLDCSGIGQLVQMRRQICDLGGVFVLLNISSRHRRLLDVLGLLRLVPVFATREEAVTACWSAQARGGVVSERWLEGIPHAARRPTTPRCQCPAPDA
jgi:anti-anti-sigma factor